MRGRKPLPADMKPHTAGATTPAVFVGPPPECPEWLDAEAHVMWGRLAPVLARLGRLDATNAESFAAYCQCWAQWRLANETVRAAGLTTLSSDGKGKTMLRIHPAATYAAEMARQLRSFAAEFGLTPSSQVRIKTAPINAEADELNSFLDS
jgi:P27 family predicted phage terminase small subunit